MAARKKRDLGGGTGSRPKRERNEETKDRGRRRRMESSQAYGSDLWTQQQDHAKMGEMLEAHSLSQWSLGSGRRYRAAEQLSSYEGLKLTSLDPAEYDLALLDGADLDPDEEHQGSEYHQTHNLSGRAMDAVDAKIFALERTKCRIVVSDGGWQVKTAAVKAGRFIDGQMSEEAGSFKTLWDLWRHVARVSIIATGCGAVFFWSDPLQGKIVTEFDDTLGMFLDTTGLPSDGVASLGRTTFWDPERLAVRFPEHKTAIYDGARKWETLLERYSINPDANDAERESSSLWRTPLFQGWKLQYAGGEDEGGVDGFSCDRIPGTTLRVLPYEYETPPCVIFNPMRQLMGRWGRTLLERSLPANQRYNQVLNSCDRSERLTPKRMFFYDPTVTDPSEIEIVRDMMFVKHTGSMQQLPQEMTPKPFNPEAARMLLDLHKEAVYNLPGLNEAHATMDLGKTMSGVAIRLVKNEIYEIFAPFEDEFSRCSGPESGKQIIRCAREVQKAKGGFSSTWRGGKEGGWLQEIGADVFDVLEKHKYRAEAEAVSGNADTPAENVAIARELMETGIITGEAYASILQHFNVFGATGNELNQAEQRIAERMVDDWMYAPIEKAKARILWPEVWMDRDFGMTFEIGAAYLNARADMIEDMDDPEVRDRLKLFKDYLDALKSNAEKRAQLAPAAPMAGQTQSLSQTGEM